MTSTRASPTLFRALFAGREADDSRLQAALEQLPHAAWLAAQKSGAILAVNGKAAALTGWSREELLARLSAEIVAVPEADQDEMHTLEPGRTRQWPAAPLRTRAGRTLPVDLRVTAFADALAGGNTMLLQAAPAEERLAQERHAAQHVQALDSLEQLIQMLSPAAEASLPAALDVIRAMLAADVAGLYQVTADQPGMRLYASSGGPPAFPARLGPSEAQYLRLPMRWGNSQRPEGYLQQSARAAGWATFLAQPVGLGPSLVGALCVAYRQGTPPPGDAPRWLTIAAHYLHQLTTHVSRAEQFERSRALALRLTDQMAGINALVEAAVVVLGPDGGVQEFNGAAARMLGYRAEEVTGLPFDHVLIGDPAITSLIQRGLARAVATGGHEGRLLRRDGEPFPASVQLQTLSEGGCVVALRDLTAEADQEQRLQQQDQLAFVGQATQAFAHEVRHPLHIISVGVQYLATLLPNAQDEVARTLTSIQTECERLSALMNGMLSWTKPVTPQFETTALEDLVERLLTRFRSKLERRNVRLTYNQGDAIPPVWADPHLIERVLVNLFDNALQAMPAGGQLMVDIHAAERPGGPVVEVSVGDTGPGISEEHRRRIFDPYFTTKADGNGLGLAICKRLITVHRGAISVESFPGVGTVFTITLPAPAAPPHEDPQP